MYNHKNKLIVNSSIFIKLFDLCRASTSIESSQENCKYQAAQALIDSYEKAKSSLSMVRTKRQSDFDKLRRDKQQIVQTIKELRMKLNKHLDELEQTSLTTLEQRYGKLEEKVCSEIRYIQEILNDWDINMRGLTSAKNRSEISKFWQATENGTKLKQKSDALVDTIKKRTKSESLEFVITPEIVNGSLDLQSFGTFVDDTIHEYTTTLQGEYDITIETDESFADSDITGCCVMGNGLVILADSTNANIKKLDKHFSVTDTCNLQDTPCTLCPVNESEVAVSLPKKKIVQFVSVKGHMKLESSVYVGYGCMCLEYSSELKRLYITYDQPMEICVFNMEGQVLQTISDVLKDIPKEVKGHNMMKHAESARDEIHTRSLSRSLSLRLGKNKKKQKEQERERIFVTLEEIMLSSSEGRIYACDIGKGLIVLSLSGEVISTIRNFKEMPEFAAKRICKGYHEDFFVYGQSEKTREHGLLYIGKDKKVKRISGDICDSDLIEAMCFDKNTNQLIVSTNSNNYIKVYTVF